MHLSAVPPEPSGSDGTADAGAGPEALLRRSALGDATAFATLYDQMAPRLFGLVRRVVRDRAQAEEVTQEAFVDIWRQSARFDPAQGSAVGWMLTIAHRKAVDRVRSSEATSRRDDTYHRQDLGSGSGDDPGHQAERRFDRQRVRQALSSLTDVQRQTIELAYFGGYTHTQVATMLDIPLGTAKTRIRDGLIRLRDALGGA